MIIRTKTLNNRDVKGVIITADTLRDFRKWLDMVNANKDHKEGARTVIDFLDKMYDEV